MYKIEENERCKFTFYLINIQKARVLSVILCLQACVIAVRIIIEKDIRH